MSPWKSRYACSQSARATQRLTAAGRLGVVSTEDLGPSQLAAFARVPDVRARHGRRYPLAVLLTLATAATAGGREQAEREAELSVAVRRPWSRNVTLGEDACQMRAA
jgi:hypothetical protein